MSKELIIAKTSIAPGQRKRVYLDVAKLYDFTDMNIPIEVIRGKEEGPILFVSGAIHGDEINGTEIVRRLLTKKALKNIKGTLIAVPIVNVHGFNTNSRYLPDRRDMNRCFPGSDSGSLGSQMANAFMTEVVEKCTHGIDLHCAALKRSNLPQVRACLEEPEVLKMAKAFNVPVILHSELRDGSLRATAMARKIPTILFEGGEALRFNEKTIKSGLQGVLSVMRDLGMLKPLKNKTAPHDVFIARSSHWLRAPHSGILSVKVNLGARVKKDQVLGVISDPFGREKHEIIARRTGIVIGLATMPLLNRGEATFHIATFEDSNTVEEHVDIFEEQYGLGSGERFLD